MEHFYPDRSSSVRLNNQIDSLAQVSSTADSKKCAKAQNDNRELTSSSDKSNISKCSVSSEFAFAVKALNYPEKLHAILSCDDLSEIISWMPHGRSWRVHRPKAFETKVLPVFFDKCKYSSFVRQVNGWGFRRITQGYDRNAYYNNHFLRGHVHLCQHMRRPAISEKTPSDPENEPDFYNMSVIDDPHSVKRSPPAVLAPNNPNELASKNSELLAVYRYKIDELNNMETLLHHSGSRDHDHHDRPLSSAMPKSPLQFIGEGVEQNNFFVPPGCAVKERSALLNTMKYEYLVALRSKQLLRDSLLSVSRSSSTLKDVLRGQACVSSHLPINATTTMSPQNLHPALVLPQKQHRVNTNDLSSLLDRGGSINVDAQQHVRDNFNIDVAHLLSKGYYPL